MPLLITFMIRNFSNGFLLGCATSLALVLAVPSSPAAYAATNDALALALFMFALGAPFGLGSLATALFLNQDD